MVALHLLHIWWNRTSKAVEKKTAVYTTFGHSGENARCSIRVDLHREPEPHRTCVMVSSVVGGGNRELLTGCVCVCVTQCVGGSSRGIVRRSSTSCYSWRRSVTRRSSPLVTRRSALCNRPGESRSSRASPNCAPETTYVLLSTVALIHPSST